MTLTMTIKIWHSELMMSNITTLSNFGCYAVIILRIVVFIIMLIVIVRNVVAPIYRVDIISKSFHPSHFSILIVI